MTEVPVTGITCVHEELEYLRPYEMDEHAWDQPMVAPLLAAEHQGDGIEKTNDVASVVADFEVLQASLCKGCCCQCCRCYPCQCPLPEAPCIDCPHVSTAQPYFNVNIFGALKLDMLFNGARPVAPGTPFFLAPGPLPGFDQDTVSIHARQSTLGAAFSGPEFGGLQSGGQVIVMFFNDNVIADQYGLLPLQAWGELRNEDWRFAAGLQFDVFAPGIPTVLPFSALAATGNAGNAFRGQIRAERFLYPASDVQWTLQLALSEPVSTTIDPAFRLSEDNGWPNVEGRVALGLGDVQGVGPAARRPFEIGISGVVGQLRTTIPTVTQVVADVWGVSGDFRWAITECCGVQGEVFTGQGLGTYNAGVLQNVNGTTFEAIRTTGGFFETYVYLTPCLHSHTGFGIDDPNNNDVDLDPLGLGRTRNSVIFSNLIWDINNTFRVGFEATWRETEYRSLPNNEGAGFHTQFQWAF